MATLIRAARRRRRGGGRSSSCAAARRPSTVGAQGDVLAGQVVVLAGSSSRHRERDLDARGGQRPHLGRPRACGSAARRRSAVAPQQRLEVVERLRAVAAARRAPCTRSNRSARARGCRSDPQCGHFTARGASRTGPAAGRRAARCRTPRSCGPAGVADPVGGPGRARAPDAPARRAKPAAESARTTSSRIASIAGQPE